MHAGAPEYFVGINIADASDDALVGQHCFYSSPAEALCEGGLQLLLQFLPSESFFKRFGPKIIQMF